MKRFVICLDGTWNNATSEVERKNPQRTTTDNKPGRWQRIKGFFKRDSEGIEPDAKSNKVYRPTNVLKVARAVDIKTDSVLQVTYYDAGVGAMNRAPTGGARIIKATDNFFGGVLGAGFEVNIEEAYSFLANNYEPGDEIFIFGFSRGAAQARSLCSFINWAGGFPDKSDVYYVPKLFTRYLEQCGRGSGKEVWDEANTRRAARNDPPLNPINPAGVQYLGIWDTVLSLGRRLRKTTPIKFQFHNTSAVPNGILCVRHALAIDELRHDFQPEIFDTGHPDMEQRWFPGVHSNVGGGLGDDSLANAALVWIASEAQTQGLVLDQTFLDFFGSSAIGPAGKRSLGFTVGDTVGKLIRGYKGARLMPPYPATTLDDSVIKRLNARKLRSKDNEVPYRPGNLMAYLKQSDHYDDRLDSIVKSDL